MTIGQVGVDGKRSYDDANAVVPGTALPVMQALELFGITKRIKFNAIKDVQLGLFFDKDAALNRKYGLMFSGVGITQPVRIRGMSGVTMMLTAGRDQTNSRYFSLGLSGHF